ncbi:MAG: hypothetical protein J5733_01415, partial [Bacteroidaceae bacterium]|nr:hypothetical protein [Bacteroidaceae bacterium]
EKPLTMAEVEKKTPQPPLGGELLLLAQNVVHQLTHQRLHADFYCLTLPASQCSMVNVDFVELKLQWGKEQWVEEKYLDRYALPRLLEKFLEKIR